MLSFSRKCTNAQLHLHPGSPPCSQDVPEHRARAWFLSPFLRRGQMRLGGRRVSCRVICSEQRTVSRPQIPVILPRNLSSGETVGERDTGRLVPPEREGGKAPEAVPSLKDEWSWQPRRRRSGRIRQRKQRRSWEEQNAKRGRDGPFGLGRGLRQAEPQSRGGEGRHRRVPPACLMRPCE